MTYIPKKNRQTIPITDKGKTISNTKPITGNKPKSVCVKGDTRQSFIREKNNDYFHPPNVIAPQMTTSAITSPTAMPRYRRLMPR